MKQKWNMERWVPNTKRIPWKNEFYIDFYFYINTVYGTVYGNVEKPWEY